MSSVHTTAILGLAVLCLLAGGAAVLAIFSGREKDRRMRLFFDVFRRARSRSHSVRPPPMPAPAREPEAPVSFAMVVPPPASSRMNHAPRASAPSIH